MLFLMFQLFTLSGNVTSQVRQKTRNIQYLYYTQRSPVSDLYYYFSITSSSWRSSVKRLKNWNMKTGTCRTMWCTFSPGHINTTEVGQTLSSLDDSMNEFQTQIPFEDEDRQTISWEFLLSDPQFSVLNIYRFLCIVTFLHKLISFCFWICCNC